MAESIDRRRFMKVSAAAAGAVIAGTTMAGAQADNLIRRNVREDRMRYAVLGRTNYLCSRLIFGCGSALAGGKAVHLLERTFEAGINFYDIGSNDYYRNAENNLAAFYKAHRGEIWVSSKGYARTTPELQPNDPITTEVAQQAAAFWTQLVENSLRDLDCDYIDAYYVQGANNPALVKSEEMGRAFEQVKSSGKIGHIGVSTHNNAEAVLDAAIETGWYDIAMAAMTPAGWYDRANNDLQAGSPPLTALRPKLDRVRSAGLGLIGMKVGRHLSVRRDLGAFDTFYPDAFTKAPLSPFQRAYGYVLEHGVDAVNADMQNFEHFEENLYAARASHELLA